MNIGNYAKIRKLQKINKEGSVSLVIPMEMVQLLGWESGNEVVVTLNDNGINVTKKENNNKRS